MMSLINNLNIIQINLHHCRAAALNLAAALLRMGVDVALIQEPWQRRGVVCGLNIRGYNILTPTSREKVLSCIVVKSNLNYLFLSNLSNADLTVARLETGSGEGGSGMLVASVYLPYEAPNPPGEGLIKVVRYS